MGVSAATRTHRSMSSSLECPADAGHRPMRAPFYVLGVRHRCAKATLWSHEMVRTQQLRVSAPLALALFAVVPPVHAQPKPAPAITLARATKPAQAQPPAEALDDTRETNLRAYTELVRSDLRAQHVAIITAVMEFTEAEGEKFWPVYREYEADLAKINDSRIALIKDYADNYETLSDAVADQLVHGAFDLEARRHALEVTYYDRFKKVISPKAAARFFQVEHQILLLLDLQIESSLPIASK